MVNILEDWGRVVWPPNKRDTVGFLFFHWSGGGGGGMRKRRRKKRERNPDVKKRQTLVASAWSPIEPGTVLVTEVCSHWLGIEPETFLPFVGQHPNHWVTGRGKRSAVSQPSNTNQSACITHKCPRYVLKYQMGGRSNTTMRRNFKTRVDGNQL